MTGQGTGQGTEDRGQRTADSGQRTADSGQDSDRGQGTRTRDTDRGLGKMPGFDCFVHELELDANPLVRLVRTWAPIMLALVVTPRLRRQRAAAWLWTKYCCKPLFYMHLHFYRHAHNHRSDAGNFLFVSGRRQ